MKRKLFIASATVVVALAGVGLTSASAAALALTAAPQHYMAYEQACAAGMSGGVPVIEATSAGTPVAGTYPQVALKGIPDTCAGLPLEVFVHADGGSVMADGVATAAAGEVPVAVNGYSATKVEAVVARLDGWLFPTTWEAPKSPVALQCVSTNKNLEPTGEDCELEVTSKGSWVNGSAHYFNIYITVNTTAESAIVTLNLQKDPFPGWNVGSVISSTNWIPVPGYDCSGEMPTLRLYPNPNNGGVAQQMFLELSERSTDNPNAICNS